MFLIFFFLSVSFYFNVITAQFQKEKKKKSSCFTIPHVSLLWRPGFLYCTLVSVKAYVGTVFVLGLELSLSVFSLVGFYSCFRRYGELWFALECVCKVGFTDLTLVWDRIVGLFRCNWGHCSSVTLVGIMEARASHRFKVFGLNIVGLWTY